MELLTSYPSNIDNLWKKEKLCTFLVDLSKKFQVLLNWFVVGENDIIRWLAHSKHQEIYILRANLKKPKSAMLWVGFGRDKF